MASAQPAAANLDVSVVTPRASAIEVLRAAVLSGTAATVTSGAALAVVATAEGKAAVQPLNATSHWLHGRKAAQVTRADLGHTAVGFGTHYGATIFWALAFEAWRLSRPSPTVSSQIRRAAAVAGLAAIVDYTITPRRFTPGWELVLSKRAMALVYAAMAIGFAATPARRSGKS